MSTWKTCVAILAILAAATANAVGTHGTRWETKNISADAAGAGAWTVELQDGQGLWASTRGDRGALGQYCSDDGACAWLLVLWDAACDEGEQHPVLVNTDRSASHHVVQCIGTLPGMRYVIIVATLLTLLFLPALYVAWHRIKEPT